MRREGSGTTPSVGAVGDIVHCPLPAILCSLNSLCCSFSKLFMVIRPKLESLCSNVNVWLNCSAKNLHSSGWQMLDMSLNPALGPEAPARHGGEPDICGEFADPVKSNVIPFTTTKKRENAGVTSSYVKDPEVGSSPVPVKLIVYGVGSAAALVAPMAAVISREIAIELRTVNDVLLFSLHTCMTVSHSCAVMRYYFGQYPLAVVLFSRVLECTACCPLIQTRRLHTHRSGPGFLWHGRPLA
jgi:hypothetical protein